MQTRRTVIQNLLPARRCSSNAAASTCCFSLLVCLIPTDLVSSSRKVSAALERRLRDVSAVSPTVAVDVEVAERLAPEGFDSIFGELVRQSARRLTPNSRAARGLGVARDKVLVNEGTSRGDGLQGRRIWMQGASRIGHLHASL